MLITLLYRTCEWHALAKLRMHTEETLEHLEKATKELGKVMRQFAEFSSENYETMELPKEVEARNRKVASDAARSGSTAAPTGGGKKRRVLNLFTYKWHALGDYVPTIRLFGPTTIYSTQVVSCLF